MLSALVATLLLVQSGEPSLVVATGTAELVLPADSATLTISCSAAVSDPESAKRQATEKIAQAKTSSGIQPNLFGPTSVLVTREDGQAFVREEANESSGPSKFDGYTMYAKRDVHGYTAYASTKARGLTPDRADAFAKSVSGIPPSTLGPSSLIEYGLKDEAAARRAALKAAFADAKTKAQEAADAAGLRLGAVVLLETGNGAILIPNYESVGTPGQPGYRSQPAKTIAARASVTVRFRLVP